MLTVYSRLTTSSGLGRFSRLLPAAGLACFLVCSLPMVSRMYGCCGGAATVNSPWSTKHVFSYLKTPQDVSAATETEISLDSNAKTTEINR